MARVPIELPGQDGKYYYPVRVDGSSGAINNQDRQRTLRKSRGHLLNMMVDTNADGSFRALVKREGVKDIYTHTDPIISNFVYVPGTSGFTFFDDTNRNDATITALESITIGTPAAHNIPTTSSSLIRSFYYRNPSFSVPQIYAYSVGTGNASLNNVAIVDADYTARNVYSSEFVNSRVTFCNDTTGAQPKNVFVSDPLDATAYNPLATGGPSEKQGELVAVKGDKSSIYMFTYDNIEVWQSASTTFPYRPILGASYGIGLYVNAPSFLRDRVIAQMDGYIGFVGNDSSAYIMRGGGEPQKISDINFDSYMRPLSSNTYGSGVTNNNFAILCDFIKTTDKRYFVVHRLSKQSQPTSPTLQIDDISFSWVYDLDTGAAHFRTTSGLDYWNCYNSILVLGTQGGPNIVSSTYCRSTGERSAAATAGDAVFGADRDKIFRITNERFSDPGGNFLCVIESANLSFDTDKFIEYIELELETGVGNSSVTNPSMTVKYSKDGGVNYTTWGTVDLGIKNDTTNRVRMNNFGRLVRHRDFRLKLELEEDCAFIVYGAYAEITGGF